MHCRRRDRAGGDLKTNEDTWLAACPGTLDGMSSNSDDGLPPVDQPFDIASLDRWPMGTVETELWSGVVVFYGQFDQRGAMTQPTRIG